MKSCSSFYLSAKPYIIMSAISGGLVQCETAIFTTKTEITVKRIESLIETEIIISSVKYFQIIAKERKSQNES